MEIFQSNLEKESYARGGYEWVGSDEALTSSSYSQDASVRALCEEPETGEKPFLQTNCWVSYCTPIHALFKYTTD
ncbi:hypothetical protein RchiOBHm_Chr6g0290081 [Rosa chinensis]|uniref:Uncharacterized protein n=1 Tax=Rosa chinensis TaxID=74649 RepID=A0A2P6PVS2_ROSCH|nr:hypothetical protein RchiOBHm_Chr6g0290081 [Rosa chinensis]